ncbi:YraN family protein [Methylopila sp. Yamaguchi]|uniref:YraN family protein n=1 Tax=Methylopila sp. Yamaguchi TaxID=1437817 RepID=UPI000CCC9C9D|nr:YraN family protein [Methylopila sp. Yamaguchi]
MSPAPPAPKRLAAFRLGLDAEARAAWLLRLTGWRILKRRYAQGGGEIDLIAVRGRTLAFVEVKARATLEAAAEAVAPRQQARIRRGAEAFLAREPAYAGYVMTFDVVLVAPRRLPRRLPNAFGQ